MNELFKKVESNRTRAGSRFEYPERKSELNGKFSLRCFGPVVWNELLPASLKSIESLDMFKEELKKWTPVCKCRLCKNYVSGVGFIN